MVYNRQQTIMKRHLLTLFLALAVSVGTLFAQSGTCGTNLTWTLDTESGILTISGTGAMKDYTYSSKPNTPWYSYRESITSVVISDGVASIGTYAFYGCSSLTSITIPSSVTSIGNYAFNYCSSLTSLTIGESVTSIGSYAFRGCSSLTSVIWNAKKCNDFSSFNTSFYYYKSGSSYNFDLRKQITSFMFGDNVESIPAFLCSGMSNMPSITIPNSVTTIGNYAFYDCSKITSDLNLNSVTTIGNSAFYGCSSLTSVTIGNSVTTIGNSAFYGCSSLTSATIGNSVTSIGEKAFHSCDGLTSITIPNSVTSIGNYAFYLCSSLTSVIIGESVTSIGYEVFRGCSKLATVIWNAKKCNNFSSSNTPFYRLIGNSSSDFDHRKQITSFTFGDDVESIPAYLCSGMSNLTYITIPNSVTIIGSFAFNDCGKITSDLNLSSVTSIGECAFRNCSNITSNLNLNNVETIGQQAFLGCSSLTKVVIGDGATSIGERAFSGCTYLEDITIGSSINVENGIGQYAFIGCRYLLSVTCKAVFPPTLNANVFEGCGVLSKIDLYVPEESIKKYQKAEVWSEFNIIGKNLDDSNIDAVENIFYNQDTHDLYKYLRNGLLFIERNGITYTAQGQRID